MKIRELTADEVRFTLNCLTEHAPYKGNCSAIDPETDAAAEKWIRDELKRGNKWAWCCVEVQATWNGLSASDFLGCCSYRSREDFCQPGGYFDDMKEQALDLLNCQAQLEFDKINALIVPE